MIPGKSHIHPGAPLYTLVYREESVRRLGFDPSQVRASARLGPLPPGSAAEALALGLYLALAFVLAGAVYASACRALRVREMTLVWELGLGVLGRLARAHRPAA